MRLRSERMTGHIGTETRSKLLREAAVRSFRQWGKPWPSNAAWAMKVLWIVKLCCKPWMIALGNESYLTTAYQKATANYVPAAAVIRRWQALSGIIGRKEWAGGSLSLRLKRGAQPHKALETDRLEYGRSEGNSMCSGEMRRYMEEHQWRRRFTSPKLTLSHESVGSK